MKTEQFSQLQAIVTLDGMCYALHEIADEIGKDVPEELEEAVENLKMRLRSFRTSVETYEIAHKDTYIDKEGSE